MAVTPCPSCGRDLVVEAAACAWCGAKNPARVKARGRQPPAALTNCPACGHQMSTEAKACPGCGNPNAVAARAKATADAKTLAIGCLVIFALSFAFAKWCTDAMFPSLAPASSPGPRGAPRDAIAMAGARVIEVRDDDVGGRDRFFAAIALKPQDRPGAAALAKMGEAIQSTRAPHDDRVLVRFYTAEQDRNDPAYAVVTIEGGETKVEMGPSRYWDGPPP